MAEEFLPETRTPYSAATDEFFALFRDALLSEASIREHVSPLMEIGMPVNSERLRDFRQKVIDGWSQRYSSEVELGDMLLIDPDELDYDEDDVLDGDTELLDGLLVDVVSFLVGSEYSALNDHQKRLLVARTLAHYSAKDVGLVGKVQLGNALAPYFAHDVERASVGLDANRCIEHGRNVMSLMTDFGLMFNRKKGTFRRMLNDPQKV